jgi:ATP-dependent DNA ligase
MHWRSNAPTRHPPGFIAPCLPTVGRTVPCGSQWAYEIKHDGFRFICWRVGESRSKTRMHRPQQD